MKLSLMGRTALATLASLTLGLAMTACGGGTIAYMWVLGDQYNQITGFKVDDFTGNLTQSPGSPFNANGSNPVYILVKPGGRFIYVINQGTGGSGPTLDSTGKVVLHKETSGGVALFSVGGDGVLTFQQSYATQGSSPQWAQFDGTGTYLYVLDKYTPDAKQASNAAGATYTGSITAFAVDGSTGRLTLVTNQAVKDATGVPTTFFNVGPTPSMLKTIGGCLFTLDSDNSIFPYTLGGSGQLGITTTGTIPTSASQLSSINGNGSLVILTDKGANKILPYTVGGTCNLSTLVGGGVPNITGTSNPVYSLIDNSGKYLYVLNQATVVTGSTTTPFSSISAFTLNTSTQQLQQIAGSPYAVGAGPVCMVEDPTNQYIYVSNRNDGTVTGKVIDSTTGELSELKRGSTFPASGLGSCLAISGAVN